MFKKKQTVPFRNPSKELSDTDAIVWFHQYKINQYNNQDYRALGWRDSESQQIRFKVLAQIADLNHHSVLDAGCGHGDLRTFLKDVYPDVHYQGIEQMRKFVAVAQRRYATWPNTTFHEGNFMTDTLPEVDYTLINGSLNYRSSDPEFIYKAIKRLYDNSKLGFGFNLLSHITPNDNLVSYNPETILTYCRTLSNHVVFKDDYADEDYTIFMYHN